MASVDEYHFETIEVASFDSTAYLESWGRLISESAHAQVVFQSPDWVSSLKYHNDEAFVCVVTDSNNTIVGLVPFTLKKYKIKFDVKVRNFAKFVLPVISIVGSEPLLSENTSLYNQFFNYLLSRFPHICGFYFDSVPCASYLWGYLHKDDSENSYSHHYLKYLPTGCRLHYSLNYSGVFSEFLAAHKKNRRRDFKKRMRKFAEENGDATTLVRIESASQVENFLKVASSISDQSWQFGKLGNRIKIDENNITRLQMLAKNGILRSYLLYFQGNPCAFRLGYQFGDRYFGFESGYDLRYKSISPGKMLTLLMLKDFEAHRPPVRLDFGVGEAQWKKDICNKTVEDASILILKPTVKNRLVIAGQKIFYRLIEIAKYVVDSKWVRRT